VDCDSFWLLTTWRKTSKRLRPLEPSPFEEIKAAAHRTTQSKIVVEFDMSVRRLHDPSRIRGDETTTEIGGFWHLHAIRKLLPIPRRTASAQKTQCDQYQSYRNRRSEKPRTIRTFNGEPTQACYRHSFLECEYKTHGAPPSFIFCPWPPRSGLISFERSFHLVERFPH